MKTYTWWLVLLLGVGCSGGKSPAPPPPCDSTCVDAAAVRALRETMKLAFNLTLQGKPVGTHDETVPCPLGGTVRVFGDATSNATQGATEVHLTYVLDHCGYAQKDTDPDATYDVKLTGTITEIGILAVQPSSTTALEMKSDAVTVEGKVYSPSVPLAGEACALELGQNGNRLAGRLCGRDVGVTL